MQLINRWQPPMVGLIRMGAFEMEFGYGSFGLYFGHVDMVPSLLHDTTGVRRKILMG